MEQTKMTTDELITSLYKFVKEEADFARTKFKILDNLVIKVDRIEERLTKVQNKLDQVISNTSSHEGRLIALEDSMKFVKGKLGFN